MVAFVHLQEKENISSFHKFGTLEEFGLPEAKTNILSIIKREELCGLSETKKDQAMELFRKHKKVFALDNFDLGCAQMWNTPSIPMITGLLPCLPFVEVNPQKQLSMKK